MDDLDSLINELGEGPTTSTNSARPTYSSKFDPRSTAIASLDDLMGSLEDTPAHTLSSSTRSSVAYSSVDSAEFDDIMAGLDQPQGYRAPPANNSKQNYNQSNPQSSPSYASNSYSSPAYNNARASTTDHASLDDLLASIETPSSNRSSTAYGQPPAYQQQRQSFVPNSRDSVVSNNGLQSIDDLMASIEGIPVSTTSSARSSTVYPAVSGSYEPVNYGSTNSQNYSNNSYGYQNEPARGPSTTQARDSRMSTNSALDSIDDLMASIGDIPSAASSRNSTYSTASSYQEPVNTNAYGAGTSSSHSSSNRDSSFDSIDDLMASIGTLPSTSSRDSYVQAKPASATTTSTTYTAHPSQYNAKNDPANNLYQQQPERSNARQSTARDELNDILSSLPDVPSQQSSASASSNNSSAPPRRAPVQPVATDKAVDDLINNISSNLGVSITKDPCGHCGKSVIGENIQALGKKWHVDHWLCANCQEPLGTNQYFEIQGKPNCLTCHKSLFAPKCGMCGDSILDRCVVALGKKWHVNHFVCAVCQQPFTGQYFTRDGMPFCELHARV